MSGAGQGEGMHEQASLSQACYDALIEGRAKQCCASAQPKNFFKTVPQLICTRTCACHVVGRFLWDEWAILPRMSQVV